MFCEKCGAELTNRENFCTKCGSKTNNTKENSEQKEQETKSISNNSKRCKFCGNTMLENEKFCIHCGKTEQGKMAIKEETKNCDTNSLKQNLKNVFENNRILKAINKFALVFAFYYPINLIINNLKLAPDLIEVLENIDIIMFYGYYIALISLYANKKYIPLMIVIFLRMTNSIIHLCVGGFSIISVERIAVILVLLFYIFKELKETQEYKKFENKYQEIKGSLEAEIKVKTCTNCGEKISTSSVFCPKCGNKT